MIPMKITINGQERDFSSPQSLDSLIENVCKNKRHVIAEVNGSIIKTNQWDNTQVSDGDSIELVAFVGGG
jgi:thiamine biosynthesis protein ThiS